MSPIERALEYVKQHLSIVDGMDGKRNGVLSIKLAQKYLDDEIRKEREAHHLLEVEHLRHFQELIDRFQGKENRLIPADWMLKIGMPSALKEWYVAHPEDNCDGQAPQKTMKKAQSRY